MHVCSRPAMGTGLFLTSKSTHADCHCELLDILEFVTFLAFEFVHLSVPSQQFSVV